MGDGWHEFAPAIGEPSKLCRCRGALYFIEIDRLRQLSGYATMRIKTMEVHMNAG
jgi:hypothetical protein